MRLIDTAQSNMIERNFYRLHKSEATHSSLTGKEESQELHIAVETRAWLQNQKIKIFY